MKKFAVVFSIATGLVATSAWASTDLAKASGCLNCHTVDKKLVGPAYQDVAKKYAGQKDAEAKIIASITTGGSGKWGPIPMPPKGGNAKLSDADIKALAKWIAGGAK